MNPQSPREELEIRITALLMGELSPEEAAVLQTQIADDAELTALRSRLGRAMGLLREASAIPEHPAPPAPARLSDERRARLLAHFKGEAMPGPVMVKLKRDGRREWKWAVPFGLAASLMALIGGAMYVNGFALRKESAAQRWAGISDSDGERWEVREEFIRSSGMGNPRSEPEDARRSYRSGAWANQFRYRTADAGASSSASGSVAGGAVVNWDRPRGTESTPSQPARAASAAGVLYLPKGATEASVSNFDASIKALVTAPIPKPPGGGAGGWTEANDPADPTATASLAPNTPPLPVVIAAATSAPEAGSPEVMRRRLHLDISSLESGVTGLDALADSQGKGAKGGDDVKPRIVDDLTNGFAAGGSKDDQRAIVVLSDSATDTAGAAIADGTLRFTGDIAQRGMAVVPVPQPTTAPKSPPPPAMPGPALRLIRPENLGDSQVALGRFQGELRVADPKPAAKMDGATDGLAVEGRDKASTTSLGLAFGKQSDLYEMAQRQDAKGDAVNGRAEAAAIDAVPRADGTKIAAGRPLGENMNASASEFSTTPATPMVPGLGNKSALSPDVVEFEGFVNHGARVQPPAPAKPASGPAQTAQAERFKESADFGTVSGVVTGSGAVTLNKSGATHWSFGGGNTFTGGTTVNAGTLSVDGGGVQGIPANRESDVQKRAQILAATGNTAATLGGFAVKSDPRVDLEVKPEPLNFSAPEIPKSFDGKWAGSVTKAGAGTLNLASGGTLASPVDAPVATPASRGGDAVLGDAFYFKNQTPPQRPAVVGIENESGAKEKELTRFGQTNALKRAADDGLPIDTSRGTEKDREKHSDREIAAVTDESIRSTQWMSSREREKFNAAGDKDVAKKSDATSGRAGVPQRDDFIEADRRSVARGRTAESKVEQQLAEVAKTPPFADLPMVGKLFSATPPAAPEESAPVSKAKVVDEAVTLYIAGVKGEPVDAKKPAVTSAPEPAISLENQRQIAKLEPLKLIDAKPKAQSEVAVQLQEKRVDEMKSELKEIEKVANPEPDAPKPAPNPLVPQPEVRTGENAFSTFSLNVSDVAFKLAAASLERGTMPDVSTLRTEEFINAFDYRDPEARAGAPLAFAAERARYPFAQNRDVVRLSVKTAAAGRQPGRPLNVVLLLDNSGSMERADRTRILQEGLRTLSAQLQPQDRLSVVTFARTPRLWADGVAGDKAGEVTARVAEITPEGGTNLAAALDLGYATALKHYQPGSINHVVLLTDGAANLGNVDPSALKQKVEAHRKQGIALDCFGIGWEGLNDDMLEQLSRNGDGRYGFINTPEEAATKFAEQLAGALRVAASDVKVQVEWNPRRVTAYRQVGYAKHQLTKEQFRDNTVDAAELTAAESGNALYVVEVNPQGTGDLATVRVRFKVPGTSDYREHEWTVPFTRAAAPLENSRSSLRLAATAAAFSEMLAGSPFATEVTSERLLGLLTGVPAIHGADERPKKLEWMIRQAKSISGR